jgi:betaine-aldehyde dehydrogenase
VTPSAALALGRAALDAGLPPGILNVLPGTGAVAGDALVRHPDVGFVSFTGGTASGRRIAAVAAGKLMPVALELGGKSPHIVFASANAAAAAAAVADGIFEASGQSCVAGSRLFIQRPVYELVLNLVAERARRLKLDLPDASGAQLGPLSSFGHRERVERFVADAQSDGGTIVTGGARPAEPHLAAGAYYVPTVVAGLTNAAAVCQQEIFGPVLCALAFDDEEDLVRQANDSAYGLAAGLWTADYRQAWRVARRLEAGTVWINTYKQLSIAAPFGGFKDSGIGREKGIGGLRLYQQPKSLYFGLDASPPG